MSSDETSKSSHKPYQIEGRPIYHMCIQTQWEAAKSSKSAYFPPTYEADGNMTHASMHKENLLDTANHFCKTIPGDWIVLEIDPDILLKICGITTLVEAPAPVGNTEAEATSTILYPHIYGGIPTTVPNLVVKEYVMRREENGSFVGVAGLL